MDFKKTFLDLTQWTLPYGYEDKIEHLLPPNMYMDEVGNYYISIGQSETLFTCHLDTVSSKHEKVNHIIDGNIIRTDGTTILGGDNKAGVCILMYLIKQKVPGTYYFFIGEECGCIGSRGALEKYPDFFGKFKRAIAFDRREKGSIITFQRSSRSASDIFADALSKEFGFNGLEYKKDPHGVFTDSAVFMSVIPECTNISAGVVAEHTNNEHVDIAYTEQVAIAASKIKWEELPVSRDPKEVESLYKYNRSNNNLGRRYYPNIYDESDLMNDNFHHRRSKSDDIIRRHFGIIEDHFCPQCEGQGIDDCNNCNGTGVIDCPTCAGVGVLEEHIVCVKCNGEGCNFCNNMGEEILFQACYTCDGKKIIGDCMECRGQGHSDCIPCNGTGSTEFGQYAENDDEDESERDYPETDLNLELDWKRWENDSMDLSAKDWDIIDADYKDQIRRFEEGGWMDVDNKNKRNKKNKKVRTKRRGKPKTRMI